MNRIIISRDVIFHENRFTIMKRLCNEMNNTNNEEYNHDITTIIHRMNVNDSLPDNIDDEAIASMFDERRNDDDADNHNTNELINKGDNMNIEDNGRVW